jgi:iron complex outermembrane receptor protein
MASAITLTLAGPGVTAHAQPNVRPASESVRRFDIPAGRLTDVLEQFARAASVSVLFDPALTQSLSSPGYRGSAPIGQALLALLAGTGLEALAQPGSGYSLRRSTPMAASTSTPVAPSTVSPAIRSSPPPPAAGSARPQEESLPAVLVRGRSERDSNAPPAFAGGDVGVAATIGVLGERSIFETPLSVRSTTAEALQNLQATNLTELLAREPSAISNTFGGTY